MRLRLHELSGRPTPTRDPPGRPRPADLEDLDVAVRWMSAFESETGLHPTDVESLARERLEAERLWLWERAESVVALAGRTAALAGVSRIGPVYTPPEHRRRGYGTAVTAACSADALDREAERVVLFTDLANPTSNGIYQTIGFRPLGNHDVVRFVP